MNTQLILSTYIAFIFSLPLTGFTESPTKRNEPIPAEIIFSHTTAYGFKLSPSGEKLLFRFWTTDGTIVGIYNLDSQEILHKFKLPSGYSANELDWATEETLVFRRNGKLVRMEIDGSKMEILINNVIDAKGSRLDKKFKFWKMIHNLPKDKAKILVSSYYEGALLYKYDIISGETEFVLNGRNLDIEAWRIDTQGQPRVGIRENDTINTYFWVEKETGTLKPLMLPNGSQLEYDNKDPTKNNYRLLDWHTQSRNVFLVENITTGFERVIEVDPLAGKLVRVLKEETGRDIGMSNAYFNIKFNPTDGSYAGHQYRLDKDYYVWESTEFKSIQNNLNTLLKNTNNEIIECSHNLRFCLVDSYTLTDQYTKYVYDQKKNQLISFYTWSEERKEYQFSDTTEISASINNKQLFANITPATNPILENQNLIIIPCGGLITGTTRKFNPYLHYFSSRGYTIFELNTRGCTGYGADYFSPESDSLANLMGEDIIDFAKWLKNKPEYLNSKLFLFSNTVYSSYKAGTAIKLNESLFDGAVLFSAILEVGSYYKHCKKNEFDTELWFWESHLKRGTPNKKIFKSLSLLDHFATTQLPILYSFGKDNSSPMLKSYEKLEKISKRKNKNIRVQTLIDTKNRIVKDTTNMYFADSAHRFFDEIARRE